MIRESRRVRVRWCLLCLMMFARTVDAVAANGTRASFLDIAARQEIPLRLIHGRNRLANAEEFFNTLAESLQAAEEDDEEEDDAFGIQDRLGRDEGEMKRIRPAKMAKCVPEPTVVPLKHDDVQTFYYPSCVRIERCGGCCSHHILSCQPIETDTVAINVVMADYAGGKKLRFRGLDTVHVERHRKCKCDCVTRPENCTKFQRYVPEKCSCQCPNANDEIKCYSEGPKKIWDRDNCSCLCKEEYQCGSGYYFDPFSCNCVYSLNKYPHKQGTRVNKQKYWNLFFVG